MRQLRRINWVNTADRRFLGFLAMLVTALAVFVSAGTSFASVSFSDGERVKLGCKTAVPPVWEARTLPGAGGGKTWLIGPPLSIGGTYGVTGSWQDSNARAYLNGTFLNANFTPEEISSGVLAPYGNQPIYNSAIPDVTNTASKVIPVSSAGGALVWIPDAQEIQAIYNGNPALPWDNSSGYSARVSYASGGPYIVRNADTTNTLQIWTIRADGGFAKDSVSKSPSNVRPAVSPSVSAMLYKRGAGTVGDPHTVCYRWDTLPSVSADARTNTITLSFPVPVTNNGAWPSSDAWEITDSFGTVYSVTGTAKTPGNGNGVTLTVFPEIRQGAELTVKYAQRYDDENRGLNNTKGAILREVSGISPAFGLPNVTMTAAAEDKDGETEGEADGEGETDKVGQSGFRILSDSVHYLVLGQPFVLGLEADGGTAPYAWSVKSDTLPDGLTLSEEGAIEGTSEVPGSFRVTLEVADSEGKTASKRFSFIVVGDEELAIMTDTLPDGRVGQFYSARLRGCGGTKPYTWEIDGPPGWLSLDSDSGTLSGTPEESEIRELTIRLLDGEDAVDAMTLRLSVYPRDGLLVTSRVLPAAVIGEDYSFSLEALGGIPPYFFAPRGGAYLPAGLTLDRDGNLSGNPGEKGVFAFVVDAVDGNNLQGSAPYTMAVVESDDLAPAPEGFTVTEDEEDKRIRLSFYLSAAFNGADVLSVGSIVSPDAYAAVSGSSVTRDNNGEYSAELVLYASERVLNGGVSWRDLVDGLSLDGIAVRFADASGEEMRFAASVPFREMKREREEKEETGDDGGGGCDTGLGALALPCVMACFAVTSKPERKRNPG